MATCDELADQLSGLQSQLAKVEAELDDPEGTCAAAGLTGDDCTLYLKSLGRQATLVRTEVAGVQQQQYLQGCLGQQVITGTLDGSAEIAIDTDPKNPFANESVVNISATLTFIGNPGSPWNVTQVSLAPIQISGGSIKFSYNGGIFDAEQGTMSLNVNLDAKVLDQDSTVTLTLITGPVQAGPYSPVGVPFDKQSQQIALAGVGQFTGGLFDQKFTFILIMDATTSNWPQS